MEFDNELQRSEWLKRHYKECGVLSKEEEMLYDAMVEEENPRCPICGYNTHRDDSEKCGLCEKLVCPDCYDYEKYLCENCVIT